MNFNTLIRNIKDIHNLLQATASKAINISLTLRNWLIGYYIVEFEQKGEDRAKYGEKLLSTLEKQFSGIGIKGMTERRFREYRSFYNTYPEIRQTLTAELINKNLPLDVTLIRQTLSAELILPEISGIMQTQSAQSDKEIGLSPSKLIHNLSFSHFAELIKIADELKRAFYEIECVKGVWSVRELQRQIESLYFERSGLSKDKKKLSALVNETAIQLQPKNIINTPVTIEFLGLNNRALVTETELEQAILDNLQMFLLEMGNGFCFEARQKGF
jgi:predicted nuclease of restriction endonuclease-like (RecB) superfamily